MSTTMAIGWSGLFNGLGEKDAQKSKPQDFLPFSDEEQSTRKVSDRTAQIIKQLIAFKLVPPAIHAAIAPLLD